MKKCIFYLSLITLLVSSLTSCKKSAIVSEKNTQTSVFDAEVSAFDTSSLRIGLVAYYPFNNNADDNSGNGHNGSIHRATATTDRYGASNSAYYFNGRSSFIRVPNDTALNLVGNFSISSWFNLKNYATMYNGSMIIAKHDGDVGNDGYIYCILNPDHNSNQCLLFEAYGAWGIIPEPRTNVQVNTWYNYTVTYDKNRKLLKYYLNGILVSFQKIAIEMIPNKLSMTIGYSKSSAGTYLDYFDGAIDDIRIYNVVLTPSQVRYLSKN